MSGVVIFACIASALLGAVMMYFIMRKIYFSKQDLIIQQAIIKGRAIEKEAEMKFQNQKIALREKEIELQKQFDNEKSNLLKEIEHKKFEFDKKELMLEQAKLSLEESKKFLSSEKNAIIHTQNQINELKKSYQDKQDSLINLLSNYTSLSLDEAKSMLLVHLEDTLKIDKANLIRRYEQEAKEDAKKHANYIIALATSRYAGEYSAEQLINVVNLPDDDMKGRIIGKDGRNIKSLEMITGVDIVIDDTPNAIVLSSFNPYRRAIAVRAMNLLIEDGRIHPARIEEIYKKCEGEMEQSILNEGESVVLDLNLGYMDDEMKKLIGKMKYRASYGQNALAHSLEVAHLSGLIASELEGDEILARRAGLLHDIGKSLTHELGGNHVTIGYDLAIKYKEHPVVLNAILAHHGNEEIKSIECAAVCAADALSSARPGARKEVLEAYIKRVSNLEKIALNQLGVRSAYAINAGREVRVIVKAEQIDDKESIIIARNIAKEIEQTMKYPSEIKVNVIREIRAVEYAR